MRRRGGRGGFADADAAASDAERHLDALVALAGEQLMFERVGLEVVVGGVTINAPNSTRAGTAPRWGRDLRSALGACAWRRRGRQGYGAIEGVGVELTVTLGTGGRALCRRRACAQPRARSRALPRREEFRGDPGQGGAARELKRREPRSRRPRHGRGCRASDLLGGGHARLITARCRHVVPISNRAGLLGGIALWRQPSAPTATRFQGSVFGLESASF